MKPILDYSLYLITDSTPAILGSRSLPSVVRAALQGGTTLVQYRAKHTDTSVMLSTARSLLTECHSLNIPLLINDRLDVALAVNANGVHIGQDDMSCTDARRLLGPDKIIGVTVNDIPTALKACRDGADYLGIGTVFATMTKTDTKDIIGIAGVREILTAMEKEGFSHVKTVCIGGLNEGNIQRVLFQSAAPGKPLDGIALVSAIIGASDPAAASEKLLKLVKTPPPFSPTVVTPTHTSAADLVSQVPAIIQAVDAQKPLSHNMTNLVVQNFAANVALAFGASPIMSNYSAEAADLASLGGALVVNMGTVTPDGLRNYQGAIQAYNATGHPIVLDPVGAGATKVRRSAVSTLLASGYFTLLKGNTLEILTLHSTHCTLQQRGVDSSSTTHSLSTRVLVATELAARERSLVLMTGETDVLSDGQRTYVIRNGHELLGEVTGTGCVLGTVISAALAIEKDGDRLAYALAAILLYEIAAERAAKREDVQGPGTFAAAFVDEIYKVRKETAAGNSEWLKAAKVEKLTVSPKT